MKSITLKDKVSKSSWRKIFCTTRSIGLSSLFCSVAIADETVSNLAKVLELQTKDPSSIELVSSNYSSKFVPSVSPGFYQLKDDMTKGELLDTSTIIAFDTVVIDGKNYSTFKFSDQALDTFKLYVTGESVVWDDSKKQLTIPKNSIFVSTQGLAMGENGGGTLQLDQWTSKNNTDEKTFIMDLSGVEESSYAFYGNLNFTGKTDGNKQNYSSKTAELRLGGKGIKGNVTLDTLANVNFVFNGTNPLVDGNITVSSDVTATFSNPNGVLVTQGITFNPNSNGTLIFKGNTSIAGGINFNNNAGGSVVFEGDTSITGTINKPGGQGIKGRESSLTFNGAINTIEKFNINDTVPNGQSIFKVIFTESTQSNTIHSLRAVGSRYQSDVSNTNYIIFKGGGHNLIDQSIEALPSSFEGKVGGTNDILFENKGEISGTIKASGGINHIVFNGTGIAEDSLITGVITAERSWLGPARPTLNHIEFKNGGKITSTQTILASGGTNKIEFSGNGNAIIVGDIKTTPANADDSYSYFTFNSTATNTITGNISVVPYGNGKAHNYFTFSAGDNFINGKMEAEWFNRGDTVVNSIEVKDNSRSFTFSGTAIARAGTNQVFTLSAGNNTIQNEGADVLFQDGGTTTVTFSGSGNASIIGNINTRRDGSANITFNSTGLNTIKGDIIGNKYGTNNTTATTTISSDKSLEITGNISTIYSAVTTISVDEGDLSLWGSISNNSGTNTISVTKGNITINGNVSGSSNSASNTIKVDDGNITALGDFSLNGGTNSIKAEQGTLTLGSSGAKSAISSGGGLTSTTTIKAKTLNAYLSKLNSGGNTNSNNSITIEAQSATAVIDELSAGTNKANGAGGITLTFDQADLTIGKMSVNSNSNNTINLSGTAVVNGNIEKANNGKNNFTLKGEATSLTLKGANNAITTLDTSATSSTLNLDASLNDNLSTTIDTISNGGNLQVNFAGINAEKSISLTLNTATSQEIKTLSILSGVKNILTLNGNNTMTIDDSVSVTEGKGLAFFLDHGTTLNLVSGMSGNGETSINIDSTSGNKSAVLTGSSVRVKNVNLSGTTSQLTLKNTQTDISTLSTTTSASSVLELDGSSNKVTATIQEIQGDNLKVLMGGDRHGAELNLNGGVIKSIEIKNADIGHNVFNFKSGTTTITDEINGQVVANTKGFTLNLDGGNLILGSAISAGDDNLGGEAEVHISAATLFLKGGTNAISKLQGNGGIVDLAMANSEGNPLTRTISTRAFKTLSVNKEYSGITTFHLYINPKESSPTKADKIIFNQNGNDFKASGTAIFTVMGNVDDILAVTYVKDGNDNVQIGEGMQDIDVVGGESLIGYDVIKAQVIKEDDGKVYLGSSTSQGVAPEIKDVARSALTVNYDLYLANFNSLNKRMGELRDNPNTQGVWARIFGGAMSSDFGAGSKTDYITAQGGYDYALNVGENVKNYVGVTIAYGKSWTKSNTLNIQAGNGASIALKDVNSSMVEVGVYNSYVADSGWYNDTILKFDYIMSTFSMTDNPSLESKTNNFAMVLSDEFGYRYKFGGDASWYIDPQVELALGYFNQSDFNREMLATNATLQASQDSIFTLRTRAGATLGKKFSVAKGFASLYVGAFYEYDYINGGNTQALSKSGVSNPLDSVQSNGRAMLNIGSNIGLTENARLYIDVEKSFGDKQRTFMQFNFGARYSF